MKDRDEEFEMKRKLYGYISCDVRKALKEIAKITDRLSRDDKSSLVYLLLSESLGPKPIDNFLKNLADYEQIFKLNGGN